MEQTARQRERERVCSMAMKFPESFYYAT